MIELKNIHKRFGKLQVLNGVDFKPMPGKITAILGPNGSGKTTLLKTLVGLTIPNKGEILLEDKPVSKNGSYRKNITYLPQIARFPDNLTPRYLISLMEKIRGQKGEYNDLVAMFSLQDHMDKKLRNLSGGSRQKINTVLTFMFDAPVIVLDEPTAGLDPLALWQLKQLLIESRESGKTIILTTHIMELVEEMADELIFLMDGKVYFKGAVNHLCEETQTGGLERAMAKILADNHV